MKLSRFALPILALTIALGVLGACKLKETSTDIPAPPDVATPPVNALKTPSGVSFKVLTVGLGSIRPTPASTVTVHYTGWTADGKMFESSYPSNKPETFGVGQVIPGWQEILQLMVVGEKRRVWIPGHLAYDNSPGPKGQLCFEIELIDIK